jgi:hypothetical protein
LAGVGHGRLQAVYIAEVRISPTVRAKLATKHQVTEQDVSEALVLTPLERAGWEHHRERGWRLLVTGKTADGRRLNAVLYPADEPDGTWWLGTAMWAAK